jgi:C4-dicarboxylate-specific signal transduction histidine kinase
MTNDEHILAAEGVRFFGEMSASISHEIKNVLAILNENSGLLDDLILMNEKGAPLNLDRIKRLSQSVERQIKRADGIVRRMNRFAHSADRFEEDVDLADTVLFVAELGERLVQMRNAKFSFEPPEPKVKCYTSRFFLENLIWRCMVRAMDGLNLESPIHIFVEKKNSGPRVRFAGVADEDKGQRHEADAPGEAELLKILEAELSVDWNQGELTILLPEK